MNNDCDHYFETGESTEFNLMLKVINSSFQHTIKHIDSVE
jgi:hypothetical protein